jgi:TonB family protein
MTIAKPHPVEAVPGRFEPAFANIQAMKSCIPALALFSLLPAAAAARDPSMPDLSLCSEAADVYYTQRDAVAALALQKKCMAGLRNDDAWTADEYRSLGYYLHAVGDYAEAIAAFDRAIALYPAPNALLLAHRGMARLELGQLDGARADFDAALVEDRNSNTAAFGLALLLEREDKPAEARAQLIRAFATGLRSPELVQRLRAHGITGAELPKQMDPPAYPSDARFQCVSGVVKVRVTIDDLGLPVAAAIEESSGNRSLDRAAVKAAYGWNFEPGVVEGKPTGGVVVAPVTFHSPCE